ARFRRRFIRVMMRLYVLGNNRCNAEIIFASRPTTMRVRLFCVARRICVAADAGLVRATSLNYCTIVS
ncbi:MAG: hypothetical protein AAFR29_03645, partial [Pseudomonadota bacterium]